ncbi:MAG: endonuclease, partial [Ruthenibacterium sp.]
QEVPAWIFTLSDDDLADGFTVVRADNVTAGVNYTSVLDGFIVSSNMKASAENVDLDFACSDHNPVLLHFTLT